MAKRSNQPASKTKQTPSNGKRPKYQLLPPPSPQEYAALKANIESRGIQVPVEHDENGDVLDGHSRTQIAEELGITKYPVRVIEGLTEEQKRHHILAGNLNRRHLSRKQKRELVEQELKQCPRITDRWLAELTGVDHKTVGAVRRRMVGNGEIPHVEKFKARDGKVYRNRSILANTPAELANARKAIRNLPPSCDGRIVDATTATRRARRHVQKQTRMAKKVEPLRGRSIRMHHCRFQDLEKKARLRPESATLVLTDIPFHKQFLDELPELAAFTERVLVDGGLLVMYSGQYCLDKVMAILGQHLTYRWVLSSAWVSEASH
ncbi:MAG: ParB N-terminal domain-containing protein [Candidatus Nealsonbacteria bacterium]|nr:ParB N-terminal domain-containing protein [Candidatus Nealsonbacteria bacterium]